MSGPTAATGPSEIESLKTIVTQAPCWSSYSRRRVFWSEAWPEDVEDTGPIAVLSLMGNRQAKIVLLADKDDMDEGQLSRLAQDLAFQIQTRYRLDMTGLHIPKEPTVSEVGEPTDAMRVTGDTTNAIEITFPYGITID